MTAIHGTTLTLRTEAGTETVTTTSSTTVTKERQVVSLSAVKVNDVVDVAGPRPTAGSPPTSPNGTGTVAATRIAIVEPSFVGRVQSVDPGGYTLVGPDGQLLTVTTTGSTTYYTGGTTKATPSAVTAGAYITAEGTQDTLTRLTADVVSVRPAPGTRPSGPGGPDGAGGWKGPTPATPSASA